MSAFDGSTASEPGPRVTLGQQELAQRLIDSVHDYAIFMLSPEGVIASWNSGAARLKGYTADEAIGRHFSMFYPQAAVDAGWPQEELRRAVQQGRMEDEGWRVRKDGSLFWANVVISPMTGSNGELLGFSKVTRDLTERRAREKLEDEGRRIHEFIAMLSHELRNPLAPIGNAVGVLRRADGSPEVARCADIIGRQVMHLSRLVDDLLDVSRVTSGRIQLRMERLEFNRLVQLAVEATRPEVDAREHRLEVRLAPAATFVEGDPARLNQVVTNLLVNAARFTPTGGVLRVIVAQDSDAATLDVIDNGVGMSEPLIQHAFDLFVQGTRELDRAHGGLGIGLTLVKEIVERHGGRVLLESAGEQHGTHVTVTLPLASSDAVPARTSAPVVVGDVAPAPPADVQRGRNILIVDDNSDAADSLAQLLGLLGHDVRVASDGPQALLMAGSDAPDIVLLDLGLPGMDGFEVARRLQLLPTLQATRLIAVTGYGQASDRAATADAGFTAHLVKPVDFEALERLLA